MTAPPDGLGAHDCTPVLVAQFPQSRKACSKALRQGIVGIVTKAAHPPIGIWGGFAATRLSAKAAKFRDVFIADLPRRQCFREAVAIELRIGARPRHRSHVDHEIDAGFPEEIDEIGDRPGRMADGEERVRVGSDDMAKAVYRGGIAAELWSKHTVSTLALDAC